VAALATAAVEDVLRKSLRVVSLSDVVMLFIIIARKQVAYASKKSSASQAQNVNSPQVH
jgi:hypothetical protein